MLSARPRSASWGVAGQRPRGRPNRYGLRGGVSPLHHVSAVQPPALRNPSSLSSFGLSRAPTSIGNSAGDEQGCNAVLGFPWQSEVKNSAHSTDRARGKSPGPHAPRSSSESPRTREAPLHRSPAPYGRAMCKGPSPLSARGVSIAGHGWKAPFGRNQPGVIRSGSAVLRRAAGQGRGVRPPAGCADDVLSNAASLASAISVRCLDGATDS